MTKQRHVRAGDRLDDDETVVIRGGPLDPALLRADVERYHDITASSVSRCSLPGTPRSTNSLRKYRWSDSTL